MEKPGFALGFFCVFSPSPVSCFDLRANVFWLVTRQKKGPILAPSAQESDSGPESRIGAIVLLYKRKRWLTRR